MKTQNPTKKKWMQHTDYMIGTYKFPQKVKDDLRREMSEVPVSVIKTGQKNSSMEETARTIFKSIREDKKLLKYQRK